MKKILNTSLALLTMLMVVLAFAFSSCEDDDGSPKIKAGNPVLLSILPDTGQGGALITVTGTGLGDMQSIVFEKESVPAYLMSTLNTETAILFRVPTDAVGGVQNVTFTNSTGKTMVTQFDVKAYPQMTSVSNYDFVAGDEITIIGTNLNDVTSVKLTGTNDMATIVSKEKKKLVITMPSTSVPRATLDVTNVTGTKKTPFEMVCITNNFIVYADAYGPGAFNGGVQNWGWGGAYSESTDEFKTGTKSLKAAYDAYGGLSLFLGSDTWADGHWFTDYFTPVYLTFWAKAIGYDVDIKCINDSPPWAGSFPSGTKIVTVPKDTWTYFKIEASTWPGSYGRFNLVSNMSAARTVYFDDILFVQ